MGARAVNKRGHDGLELALSLSRQGRVTVISLLPEREIGRAAWSLIALRLLREAGVEILCRVRLVDVGGGAVITRAAGARR